MLERGVSLTSEFVKGAKEQRNQSLRLANGGSESPVDLKLRSGPNDVVSSQCLVQTSSSHGAKTPRLSRSGDPEQIHDPSVAPGSARSDVFALAFSSYTPSLSGGALLALRSVPCSESGVESSGNPPHDQNLRRRSRGGIMSYRKEI